MQTPVFLLPDVLSVLNIVINNKNCFGAESLQNIKGPEILNHLRYLYTRRQMANDLTFELLLDSV